MTIDQVIKWSSEYLSTNSQPEIVQNTPWSYVATICNRRRLYLFETHA